MGSSVAHCGARVGDGQAEAGEPAPLRVHIAAAGEALAYAEALDLDPRFVFETIRHGAANSFMLEDRGERMLNEEFVPPKVLGHLREGHQPYARPPRSRASRPRCPPQRWSCIWQVKRRAWAPRTTPGSSACSGSGRPRASEGWKRTRSQMNRQGHPRIGQSRGLASVLDAAVGSLVTSLAEPSMFSTTSTSLKERGSGGSLVHRMRQSCPACTRVN